MKEIIKILTERNQTISTMESCTGGGVANEITNTEGASEVLKFSAVTYCNDFKIKMGVPSETITKYTVYSIQTARAMAKAISDFTKSDYGIGITGKLNRVDIHNLAGNDNEVFVSIYDGHKYTDLNIVVSGNSRAINKENVIKKIEDTMKNILNRNL